MKFTPYSIKHITQAVATTLCLISMADAAPQSITAPGGDLKVTVDVTAEGQLVYSVTDAKTPVLAQSLLGVIADGVNLGENATIGETETRKIDETYPVFGGHREARHSSVEARIPVTSHSKTYHLLVRVQNDGVAVQYQLPAETKFLNGELTSWVPASPKMAGWQDMSDCAEAEDHWTGWNGVPNEKRITGLLTVQTANHWLFISEANNVNYPDFALVRKDASVSPVWYTRPSGFAIDKPERLTTPWRTVTIARDLTTLVNSDLIQNLCPAPAKDIDFSFVKPGRILWQWCSIGAPKLDDQKDWYDAAAKLGWEYYMIDDGWRNWRTADRDQWQLLKEVIDYGESKGVETIIWVDSKEFIGDPAKRLAYLEKVKATGAVGIKIDFIPSANEQVMQWYDDTLKETAKFGLMTNFHGCTKPTGRERTWPHALTREAIRGNEWHMTRYNRKQRLDHDTIQPFTRLLAGAGDLTPLVADPKQLNGFTLPHMMAQAVTTISPLACFYDHYQFYVGSPVEDLLAEIPVVWDETLVLPCTEVGKVAGFARRKGDDWWIGIVNGGQDSKITLDLDFLKSKANAVTLLDAEDPAKVKRAEVVVSPSQKIKLTLRKGGGFFAQMKSISK